MEVKLSISSSRRISFASDFKDFDLEVEELENERDNPSYRRSVNYHSDSDDDDVESNYVKLLFEKKLIREINNEVVKNHWDEGTFYTHLIRNLF